MDDPAKSPSRQRWLEFAHWAALLGPQVVFFAAIFNRFVPLQEGWLQSWAIEMEAGKVPYVDFFSFIQPLSLLQIYAEHHLSELFISYRLWGLAERLLLTTVLWRLLRQHFGEIASVLGASVASFALAAQVADLFYGFLQTCLLLSLAAAIFAQRAVRREGVSAWEGFAAGAFAALSFFIKQSSGLVMLFAILSVLVLCARNIRDALRQFLSAAMAAALVAAPILLWLARHHAIDAWFAQVFRGGAAAKGSLFSVLFGFIFRALTPETIALALSSVASLALAIRVGWLRIREPGTFAPRWFGLIAIAGTVAVLGAWLAVEIEPIYWHDYWAQVSALHAIARVAFFGLALVSALGAFDRVLLPGRFPRCAALLPLSAPAFFWAYSCGTSYEICTPALVPGYALILAFAFERISARGARVQFGAVAASSFFIAIVCAQRFSIPYSWWGWSEPPVASESKASDIPEFAGLRLSEETLQAFEGIREAILKQTKPDDTIFESPHFTIFGNLTKRRRVGFSVVHYFDVCPDSIVEQDAALLLREPPRILVVQYFDNEAWRFHEATFRGGRRSGMRVLQEALDLLTSSGRYRLVLTHQDRMFGWPVRLWIRDDDPGPLR